MSTSNIFKIFKESSDDFLNSKVKGFAEYVIRTRAIPNIMDGCRVGARKIVYAALTGELGKVEEAKVTNLIGDVFKLKYHHGPAALKNTIEQLAMKQVFEYGPFDIPGSIPTLRSKSNTADRYLDVSLSKYASIFKMDFDLLKIKEEEGTKIEPEFFLPIIPVCLLWRTNSPGFGFGYRSFSFDIDDVIDATLNAINTGSCSDINYVQLKPKIAGIKQENIVFNENKKTWFNIGNYSVNFNTDILHITDLPFTQTYQTMRDTLFDLKEQYKIADYTDNSNAKNGIDIKVKFPKGRLELMYREKWKFYKMFKLFAKIPKLNLNAIDSDGKTILNFDTPNDLINTFVRKRKFYFADRRKLRIDALEKKIDHLNNRIRFIQLFISGELVIIKRKDTDIKKDLDKFGLYHDNLDLPIKRLTLDEIQKADDNMNKLKVELDYYERSTPESLYIDDLIELKQLVSKIETPNII